MDLLSSVFSLVGGLVLIVPSFRQLDNFKKFSEYISSFNSNGADELQKQLLKDMHDYASLPNVNDIRLIKIGATLIITAFIFDVFASFQPIFF